MCRFPQKEISEISIIQDNNDIHIDPKPRYRICGNFREISEISINLEDEGEGRSR
jgi:hypothetical protein